MSNLLLLSGGIDSVAIAAWKRPKICLTIDYGQKPANTEIQASQQVCNDLGLNHHVLKTDICSLGAGDMSGYSTSPCSEHSEFWPYRNQYLITLAAMIAIKNNCKDILIGTVRTDSRHKDGSKEFIQMMNSLLSFQEGSLGLLAPARKLTTLELVQKSDIPLSTLSWSHSCYVSNLACGHCDGCNKHTELMNDLGIER